MTIESKYEMPEDSKECEENTVRYEIFSSTRQIELIVDLIQNDLSEPYSIYTYRYFVYQWPDLCKLAYVGEKLVGAIICKLVPSGECNEGYVAMLVVSEKYRRMGIGMKLITLILYRMIELNVTKVFLETDVANYKALALYQKFGFYREKILPSYYFDGASAFVLKLNLNNPAKHP